MLDFKRVFNIKNTYDLLDQINTVAVEYYNDVVRNGTDDLEQLKYYLLCLDRIYQEGFQSPLRDSEYDEIHEYYIDRGGEMIRGDMSSGDKAHHVYPDLKGTIRKVHFITEEDRLKNGNVKSQKSFQSWYENVLRQLDDAGILGETVNLGFYTKFDGLSVILEIEHGKVKSAITRGDKETGEGQDKTAMFSMMDFQDICNKLGVDSLGIKCEAVMKKSVFPEYNKEFGQGKLIDERTAVSSILNMDYPTAEQMKYVTLIPLMVNINGNEFPLPNNELHGFEWVDDLYYTGSLKASVGFNKEAYIAVKDIIKWMSDRLVKGFDYPVDGIVIRIEDLPYKQYLGRNEEECVNNWERAYKFPPATAKSHVIDVVQEIGVLGKVSFVAKVEPVKLKNKVIKSISIGSLDRFKALNLAKGDEVIIQYDIIPYLTIDSTCAKSGNEPFEVISFCPTCGAELVYDPELSCVNPECPTRIIGKVYNYCAKIGIEGIGPEIVTRLYYLGLLKSIVDLYKLTPETLHDYGFGPVESKNIVKAIKRVKAVDDYVLFGSLGIPSVSRKIFERILKVLSVDELMGLADDKRSYERLFDVPGIKSKTARRILAGFLPMKDEIRELMGYVKLNKAKSYKSTICFTKVRDHDFEAYLNTIGVGVTEALSKNTDLLVAGSMDSSKVTKATKWGIPIVTLDAAYKMYGYKP